MPHKSPTTTKPKRKAKPKTATKRGSSDPAQHKRFLEAAKAAEASDEPEAFEKAFKRVAARKP